MSIAVNGISKRFGDFVALRDVNLTVNTGELVALLGPSGSGKTTLLRIIAGLERPDPGGEIRFHQEDMADRPVGDRRVGFVFQHYALFRHMTVWENVAFGLKVRPRRDRLPRPDLARRVDRLLGLVQMTALARRFPHQLSGGQRQRVALARALAIEPRVLLLDEPFGALDARVRRELRSWLRQLHAELRVTSVFVTHDQDEALEVADRVVVMNEGRVEQVGSPDDVFHRPRSEFVARFLGEVNRLEAEVTDSCIRVAPLALSLPLTEPAGAGPAWIYVRPHDFGIDDHANGSPSFRATVVRFHSAGPTVRLDLCANGQRLTAAVSQAQGAALGIREGESVWVSPRAWHVFGAGGARGNP